MATIETSATVTAGVGGNTATALDPAARSLLRVAMVSPYSLSVPGGVQAQVMGLARELRAMGIEVRVLAPCDGPPPATFVTPLGNSLPTAANGSIAPVAPDPSCALRTIRALVDERFDVVHLHEPFVPGPTMTAAVLHLAPVIATFHAAGEGTRWYRQMRAVVESIGENIDARVAVSNDARALAASVFPGDYDVYFNGVELDAYRASPARTAPGPTIFFCGRHEQRKGLDVLLAAMAHLPESVTLWVAGSGPDTERLKASVRRDHRIVWLGRPDDADKIAYLKGATVFCAPSLHGESFGVVLVEAMAAGTAVVASGISGYRNVATDEVDALLVEPGNPAELATALKRVLFDPALAHRLERAGSARAEHFSMRRLAELYAERYHAMRAAAAVGATDERGVRARVRAWLARMMNPRKRRVPHD